MTIFVGVARLSVVARAFRAEDEKWEKLIVAKDGNYR